MSASPPLLSSQYTSTCIILRRDWLQLFEGSIETVRERTSLNPHPPHPVQAGQWWLVIVDWQFGDWWFVVGELWWWIVVVVVVVVWIGTHHPLHPVQAGQWLVIGTLAIGDLLLVNGRVFFHHSPDSGLISAKSHQQLLSRSTSAWPTPHSCWVSII